MEIYTFMCVLILFTQKFKLTHGVEPKDEYTADREYWKWKQNLTEIPDDIPADALRVNIAYNNITTVRANAFSHLSQCKTLSLGTNKISEIEPGAFNGLTDVTDFRMLGSRLTKLFANMFSDLNNCGIMVIQQSRIREVEPGSFNGLIKLRSLYFSFNGIKALKAGMFLGLLDIGTLFLNRNGITSIEDGTFASLKTLKVLYLEKNSLDSLRPGMFFGLESLSKLVLDSNHLTTLPADVFSYLPRPLNLALHDFRLNKTTDNPLQCNTDLCWLKKEEQEGTIVWWYFGKGTEPWEPFKPICANGIDWDVLNCDNIDGTTESGIEMMTTTITEITIAEEIHDKLQWILITVGAVSVSIIVTLIIVFICLKRHGVIVCQRAAPKNTNETTSVSNPEDDRNRSRGPFPGNSINNIQMGFPDRAVSDTGSEYTYPRPQSDLYEEARDSILETDTDSGYTRPV